MYAAFLRVIAAHPEMWGRITVPEPHSFYICPQEKPLCLDDGFNCSYTMALHGLTTWWCTCC